MAKGSASERPDPADIGQQDWPPGLPPLASSSPMAGGEIGATRQGQLTDGRDVVVKRCPFPADAELDGLRALGDAGAPVPTVLGVSGNLLVLGYVAGPPDWAGLGRAVADLHRHTGPGFGWHRDNWAGRFVQRNDWHQDWSIFYAELRVRIHLGDPLVPTAIRARLERACDRALPALLPQSPPASLTHGDLWAGNVAGGRCLIDPEVSYADRELDVAYMQRSRSLPAEFHQAYAEAWPLPVDFEVRRPALQLHHLLLQVRHFGATRLAGVEAVLDHYGW